MFNIKIDHRCLLSLKKTIHGELLRKGQPWDFFGRTYAKAETPVLWPPHVKSWLIEKDSDAGRDWGQEEKGMTENEMTGWYHWLNGHEYEWTPGVGDGQGGLVCCDSWGRKESDMTEWLNWTELKLVSVLPWLMQEWKKHTLVHYNAFEGISAVVPPRFVAMCGGVYFEFLIGIGLFPDFLPPHFGCCIVCCHFSVFHVSLY